MDIERSDIEYLRGILDNHNTRKETREALTRLIAYAEAAKELMDAAESFDGESKGGRSVWWMRKAPLSGLWQYGTDGQYLGENPPRNSPLDAFKVIRKEQP
jgi:hypothetical protein